MTRLNQVRKVLYYTLGLNIAVALVKGLYGYKIDSISMLSDGFHSFFDGTSNIVGLIGIWIASQPPDESHPYGHRKYETLSTIAIAVLIFFAGFEILKKAYARLQSPQSIDVTGLSFIIMAITLSINIGVMLYETKKSRELKSDFLMADAMHTKTDIFVSLSVVISLIAAKIGYLFIDTAAAFVITILIAKMGFNILKSAASVLTDAAQINPDEILKVVNSIEGVRDCHEIRTRGKEGAVLIDLHVLIDPEVKIEEAHELAHTVEEGIKQQFPSVIDVVVHVEPYRDNPARQKK
jgi:cation diffusion facilitator family transporter